MGATLQSAVGLVARTKVLNCTLKICLHCPGDGIGIRVGLRSQILRVRVSLGAPKFYWLVAKLVVALDC